ncbi:MAG: sigma-54 dependent transcriptional regulator, partial [Acidobacteriota bacterium]
MRRRGRRRKKAEPIGQSPVFRDLLRQAEAVALSDVPVLLTGESGTGKEVLARFLHQEGSRWDGPFLPVNAAARPSTLLESELFGHEAGAFTGATRRREGLFKRADGGTLLIDEIGDLDLALQAKLLRILQLGELRPVGADRVVRVDVRVVCATHRDLPALVREGTFREDLYYRISVFTLEVPPLRERGEDIDLIAHSILEHHRPGSTEMVSESFRRALGRHAWPGNVRELENACRHALVLCRPGEPLAPKHLPPRVRHVDDEVLYPQRQTTLRSARERAERKKILEALEMSSGNRTRAARRLGIS